MMFRPSGAALFVWLPIPWLMPWARDLPPLRGRLTCVPKRLGKKVLLAHLQGIPGFVLLDLKSEKLVNRL